MRQTAVRGDASATQGWGESDVDGMVAGLEFVYPQREAAREIGCRAKQYLIDQRRTWRDHAEQLQAWLLSL